MLTAFLNLLLTIAILLWIRRIFRAWATITRVPLVPLCPIPQDSLPNLTIVIPARNEEKNLPSCLHSIESQLRENISCLVINDRSSDQTEAILKIWGYQEINSEPRHQKSYLNLKSSPPYGWTGKNNALHAASTYLNSDWLLFTDADTIHAPGGLCSALSHATKNQLALLTLTPGCLTATWMEHLIQPTAMALMGLWFPLERVNQPRRPEHFANGQFFMIQKKLYQQLGGHKSVADCFLEDFALMRKAKETGANVACHLGQEIYGTRMYQTGKDIWCGWRRIYLHSAERSPGALLKHFAELCAASILPTAVLPFLVYAQLAGSPLTALTRILALSWILIVAMTSIGTYKTLRAPRRYALLHPIAAIIAAGILLDALRVSLLRLETKWRG